MTFPLTKTSFGTYQRYLSALAGNEVFSASSDSYDLLVTETLTTNEASIDFTNLNTSFGSDYEHLIIQGTFKTTRNNTTDNIKMTANSLGGTNYSWHLSLTTSSVTNYGGADQASMLIAPTNGETNLDYYSGFIIDILDFSNTNKFKTVKSFGGDEQGGLAWGSGLIKTTSAIDSLSFSSWTGGTNIRAGSRISIYGLKVS